MAKAALDKVGLILIGHGSKLPHNRENLEKLAEILRQRSKFKIVEIAFMVKDTPTITEAIELLAKKGVFKNRFGSSFSLFWRAHNGDF